MELIYDEAAALYPGASFPEGQDAEFVKTEVLLVEKDGEILEDADVDAPENERELEALAIAGKIRSMVGHDLVLDKETGEYRPVRYGDIVILLRSATGWAETFGEVLAARGIPSYTASRTGYFSTTEVVTLLNYLRVLDNPLQDIPLTGVLRSPIVGCTTEELAELRIAYPEGMICECVRAFVEDYREHRIFEEKKKTLGEKLSRFWDTNERTPGYGCIYAGPPADPGSVGTYRIWKPCKGYARWRTEKCKPEHAGGKSHGIREDKLSWSV